MPTESHQSKKLLDSWRQHARQLKTETLIIYLAYRDPRTPWLAKILIACVIGYALSPIDLIPDFVPILGYLDDLVLIPLGITLAIKLIPAELMRGCRNWAANAGNAPKSFGKMAAVFIVAVWLSLAVWLFKILLFR